MDSEPSRPVPSRQPSDCHRSRMGQSLLKLRTTAQQRPPENPRRRPAPPERRSRVQLSAAADEPIDASILRRVPGTTTDQIAHLKTKGLQDSEGRTGPAGTHSVSSSGRRRQRPRLSPASRAVALPGSHRMTSGETGGGPFSSPFQPQMGNRAAVADRPPQRGVKIERPHNDMT